MTRIPGPGRAWRRAGPCVPEPIIRWMPERLTRVWIETPNAPEGFISVQGIASEPDELESEIAQTDDEELIVASRLLINRRRDRLLQSLVDHV